MLGALAVNQQTSNVCTIVVSGNHCSQMTLRDCCGRPTQGSLWSGSLQEERDTNYYESQRKRAISWFACWSSTLCQLAFLFSRVRRSSAPNYFKRCNQGRKQITGDRQCKLCALDTNSKSTLPMRTQLEASCCSVNFQDNSFRKAVTTRHAFASATHRSDSLISSV